MDYCGMGCNNSLTFGFSSLLQLQYEYTDFSDRIAYYAYQDDDWARISRSGGLDCGHFRLEVTGSTYRLFINGEQVQELLFEPAQGPLWSSPLKVYSSTISP